MDLELLGSLGWRAGLIAIIGLLLLYIIVLYLRMRRLQQAVAARQPLAAQAAVAAYHAVQESASPAALAVEAPAVTEVRVAGDAQATTGARAAAGEVDAARPAFAWNEPPPEIPGQAQIDALQRELHALRCQVDELRAEVLAAREDCRQPPALPVPQAAAPLYQDAMQMASEGRDATSIAQHCGIARAEADLVVALARNRRPGLKK